MQRENTRAWDQRALNAYFRAAKRAGGQCLQPGGLPDTFSDPRNGRHYVALSNCNGLLAVYRVQKDDSLKRLKRPPGFFTAD